MNKLQCGAHNSDLLEVGSPGLRRDGRFSNFPALKPEQHRWLLTVDVFLGQDSPEKDRYLKDPVTEPLG